MVLPANVSASSVNVCVLVGLLERACGSSRSAYGSGRYDILPSCTPSTHYPPPAPCDKLCPGSAAVAAQPPADRQ